MNRFRSILFSREFRWRHAFLLLIVAFVAANWRLLTGQAYEQWDAYDLAAPYYSLLADFIRAGRFLYWDPWMAGGSPDYAIPGSGTFSPDILLIAAITGPGGFGYVIYWLVIWLAGGVGILFLARHLGAPAWGGLVVALGFVFSGYYTGHAEHSGVIYSYSLLPFIIWRLDVALLRQRILPAAQAGALCGLGGLAGYPALTVFTFCFATAWAFCRCFAGDKAEPRASWRYAFVILALLGVVGVAVMSPSYISAAFEGRGYSDRSVPLPRDLVLRSNALHPGALATLATPAFAPLKFAQHNLWSYTDASCLSLYTGAVTVLLALFSLGGPVRERRWRWGLFALALVTLACAMSQTFPLRGWIYDLIPPTRYFRHAAMLRCYFLFTISVLALFGAIDATRWQGLRSLSRRLIIIAPVLAILSVSAFAVVETVASVEQPKLALTVLHLVAIWGGIVLLAFALRHRFAMFARLLPALLVFIAIIDMLLNAALSERMLMKLGPRPDFPLSSSTSINPGVRGFTRAWGIDSGNENLFWRVPTLRNYVPFKNRFHEIISSVPYFARTALGENRIWFKSDVPEVPPNDEAFLMLANRMDELKTAVMVRHSRASLLEGRSSPNEIEKISQLSPAINLHPDVIEYSADKLVLDIDAPADGWAMITDRWSRSWEAKVNGIPREVSGANFIFRAVPVVSGRNHIEFSFHPFALPALVFFSWSILGVIVALSLARLPVRRVSLTSAEVGQSALLPAME